MTFDPRQADDPARIEALRAQQQRQAARGCLLVLVLEGAALLAAGLWVLAIFLELPRLKAAGFGAFVAFTLAALAAGAWLLILGNLPSQRRLRRASELGRTDGADAAPGNGGAGSGPDKGLN